MGDKEKVLKAYKNQVVVQKPVHEWRILDPYGEREGPSIIGKGRTEDEAWADAAERLK
jgi:hypothetical protein